MATFGAAALVAVVVGIGYRYLPAAVEVTEEATETVTTSTVDWTTVGMGALVITVVAVVLAALFTPGREAGVQLGAVGG
jgi:hypothetical protein